MITIIDYHAGNIDSVRNMLLRLGISSVISNQVKDIEEASHFILPGVGSFDYDPYKAVIVSYPSRGPLRKSLTFLNLPIRL